MKTFKHLFLALVTSLLLSAGLANAAESLDVVTHSSSVKHVDGGPPTIPCVIAE
jgi:hypothetical protein